MWDALRDANGLIFGQKVLCIGTITADISFWLNHRQYRQMGDHGLHSQAAIEIRRQQRVHPADVLVTAFHAVTSSPERDDRDQPRFLIRNHDQASGESRYILERTGDGGWNRGLHAGGFLGLGNKFNAQSSDSRSP